LAGAGLEEHEVIRLLALKPAKRDDWTTFLILTSDDELRHVRRERYLGPEHH